MSRSTVTVVAPSRLHFGLFSFGGGERQFGGVGAMIEQPALRLVASSHDSFQAVGENADRVRVFAQTWREFHRFDRPLHCRLEVLESPPAHCGLGSGTQLGLAVAAALNTLHKLPNPTPLELATSVRRGLRSAVGTYGFFSGGLIVERGKFPHEAISPLDCRLALPNAWRFVLIRPLGAAGLSGAEEQQAFDTLPSVSPAVTEQLVREVRERLLPAAASGDFELFSASLFQFGHAAGLCFAGKQGGAYNGPRLTALVEHLRSLGVRGVGQSSWGPTLFALAENDSAARSLANQLQSSTEFGTLEIRITPPDNRGARVSNERIYP